MLTNPVFFIGAPRSGTTIISEFILQHPDLAWPSNYQERFPTWVSVNLARRLFDNSSWRCIGKKRQINGASLLNRFLFTPGECYSMWSYLAGPATNFRHDFLLKDRATTERAQFMRTYFHRMTGYQKRKRFACKLTGPGRLGYLSDAFPGAIFVNIRRRLIPTVKSLLKVRFWGEDGARKLWWSGAYSQSELQWANAHARNAALVTAFQLKKIEQVLAYETRFAQPRILHVDYEDFVQSPESVVARILTFCELEPNAVIASYIAENPVIDRNKSDEQCFCSATVKAIQSIELDDLPA